MQTLTLTTYSVDDAKRLLAEAESQDFYYTKMNEANKKARRNPYTVSGVNSPTTMTFEVESWIRYQKKDIPIVLLDPASDSGLPHTRGGQGSTGVICLPHFFAWKPNPTTMLHELIHISQKQNPEKWWAWYKNTWNFTKLEDETRIPEKWRSIVRRNPDTLDAPFVVWQDRYVPLAVFTSPTPSDIRETARGFYDLQRSVWTWEEPPGWIRMFGQGFNDEHPHEIAAHWIDGSGGAERQNYFNLHPV